MPGRGDELFLDVFWGSTIVIELWRRHGGRETCTRKNQHERSGGEGSAERICGFVLSVRPVVDVAVGVTWDLRLSGSNGWFSQPPTHGVPPFE